jgi:hypothetical protein
MQTKAFYKDIDFSGILRSVTGCLQKNVSTPWKELIFKGQWSKKKNSPCIL